MNEWVIRQCAGCGLDRKLRDWWINPDAVFLCNDCGAANCFDENGGPRLAHEGDMATFTPGVRAAIALAMRSAPLDEETRDKIQDLAFQR